MSMRALVDTLTRRPYSRRQEPRRLDIENLEDRITPAANITIADASILEGQSGTTNVLVEVRVSEPHSNAVSVNYSTANGSALAGSDYNAVSGTLTFKKNEMTKTISIPVRGDRLAEGNESFSVQLSNGKTAVIADGTATVTIIDDEPLISIGNASAAEGNSGTTEFKFTVTLSGAIDQAVTVNYATGDGTALASDGDYVAKTGSVTFNPGGPTSQDITVVVNGDTKAEDDEYFIVKLTGASSNAQISNDTGYGSIYDDEPYVSITGWSAAEGNSGTTEFKFTVTLSAASNAPVTVNFATADGSALVSDNDYVAKNVTVTFNPGDPLSQDITVLVNGDTNAEYDEYFAVNLTNVSPNAHISNSTAYGNIYDDEPKFNIYDSTFYYDTTYFVFTVTLSTAPTDGPVTVDFTTVDGTAIAGYDYAFNSGTLTFGIGETTQYIYVDVLNFNYTDVYFYVQLSNPTPPVQLGNEWAAGYWYYDYGYYYYDPGYYW